ncbi:MAG: SGNH/GDSL hydrolase family protein [Candidatus Aminicenantes bacterium]|nr:SGNH/GDSL hydrolase family protein [Candidatus Aminicenantes bacterium]
MKFRAGRWLFLVVVALLISGCAPSGRGIIVFCAGDSITAAAYPHFLQRILNRDGIAARVLNYGRSGYTSGEYLNFLVKYRAKLIEEKPDVVLLELGTNDLRTDRDFTPTEKFRANMKGILGVFRTFRSRSGRIPTILIATIPDIPETRLANFSAESARRVQAEINPAIREIAAGEGIKVVDQHAVFVRRPDLLPEVHPARDGYRLMAETWREALRPRY